MTEQELRMHMGLVARNRKEKKIAAKMSKNLPKEENNENI